MNKDFLAFKLIKDKYVAAYYGMTPQTVLKYKKSIKYNNRYKAMYSYYVNEYINNLTEEELHTYAGDTSLFLDALKKQYN